MERHEVLSVPCRAGLACRPRHGTNPSLPCRARPRHEDLNRSQTAQLKTCIHHNSKEMHNSAEFDQITFSRHSNSNHLSIIHAYNYIQVIYPEFMHKNTSHLSIIHAYKSSNPGFHITSLRTRAKTPKPQDTVTP